MRWDASLITDFWRILKVSAPNGVALDLRDYTASLTLRRRWSDQSSATWPVALGLTSGLVLVFADLATLEAVGIGRYAWSINATHPLGDDRHIASGELTIRRS